MEKDVLGNPCIEDFRGEYFFLSNFCDRGFTWKGILFHSREQAYMWEKTEIESEKTAILEQLTPAKVKQYCSRHANNITLRPDWDDMRYGIMLAVIEEWYNQNPDMKDRLLATGDAILTEGNWWHDNAWGDCIWASREDVKTGRRCERCKSTPGQNWLGKIHMFLRTKFRN